MATRRDFDSTEDSRSGIPQQGGLSSDRLSDQDDMDTTSVSNDLEDDEDLDTDDADLDMDEDVDDDTDDE